MAYVQVSRRIRKFNERVVLWPAVVILCAKKLLFLPLFTPFLFDVFVVVHLHMKHIVHHTNGIRKPPPFIHDTSEGGFFLLIV